MKTQLIKLIALPAAAIVLGAVGCSKSSDTPQSTGAELKASGANVVANKLLAEKVSIDPNTPLDQFVLVSNPLTSTTREGNTNFHNYGSDYVFVYFATCKCEIDYDELAQNVSLNYAETDDAFKKKELLEKLKPGIDAKLARYKESRLIKIYDDVFFESYDFNSKSFPIANPVPVKDVRALTFLQVDRGDNDMNMAVGDKELTAHYSSIANISVTDEATARQIEASKSSTSENTSLVIYAYVQSSGVEKARKCMAGSCFDEPRRGINLQVVKYSLEDSNKKTLVGPLTPN